MKIIFFISFLLCCSCSRNSLSTFDYNKSKIPWMNCFKDRVFFSALREAYKSDSLIFKLIEKKDAFNPYDGLTLKETIIAEDIGVNLIKNMPAAIFCENCAEGVNYYLATALHYYSSKQLNSIALKYYKIHSNINN